MKILLLGHKGYLGSYLYKYLSVDVLDNKKRRIYDNGKKYDYVINCIGRSNLEYCEIHKRETNYSNYLVIRDIKKIYPSAKIINFSSYYIYDDVGLCKEGAKITTKYEYCKQKLLAEKENSKGVTFRLGKLFGNRNAKQKKLTEHILEADHLTLDLVKFNPTSVAQVLRTVAYELENKNLTGVFNLSNHGTTSHYNYGKFILNYLNIEKSIKKVPRIRKSFHNYGRFQMDTEKLAKHLPLKYWQVDMKSYLDEIEYNKNSVYNL